VDKSKKEITSETQFDPHAISSPPSQTSPQSACRPRPHRSRSAVASCKPSCKSIDGSVVSVAPNTSLYEPRSAEPQLESILKKNLKKRIKFSTSRLPVGIRKHGDLAIIDIPGNDGHIWVCYQSPQSQSTITGSFLPSIIASFLTNDSF